MTATFGSLFSGIGGMDLGLERAGWECLWQVEKDEWRRRVLAKHWPGVPRYADIHEVDHEQLSPVTLIAGGDPCQANSLAGKGAVEGVHDITLGSRFLEVIEAVRPELVLRENPPARSDAPWPWWRFADGLRSLGYRAFPFALRACCLGGDHKRQRVFVLGISADNDSRRELQSEGGEREERGRFADCDEEDVADVTGTRLERTNGIGFRERQRPEPNEGCWTDWALSPVVVRDVHGVSAGLDSDPTDRAKRIAALGDSVTPPMARWIGQLLIEING